MSARVGQTVIVEMPDQRLLAIQSLDPQEDHTLMDELLESNVKFQELVAKSREQPSQAFLSWVKQFQHGVFPNQFVS